MSSVRRVGVRGARLLRGERHASGIFDPACGNPATISAAAGANIVGMPTTFPALRAVAIDATDARAVAEFWRELLGYSYRPGDEPPASGEPDPKADDWLVLRDPTGTARVAVQAVRELPRSTWPDPKVPQQLHLDLTVADTDQLAAQHDRALALGAQVLEDRSTDPAEPLYVFADPAGHPFCIFVSPDHPG